MAVTLRRARPHICEDGCVHAHLAATTSREDFRHLGWWENTDRVMARFGRGADESQVKLVKRAVLRFALSVPAGTPERARAEPVIQALRQQEPEWVNDAEELLYESATVAPFNQSPRSPPPGPLKVWITVVPPSIEK